MHKLALIGLSLALASCGSMADTEAAEAQVAAFHRSYDAERFGPLYDRSAPAMQQTGPKASFVGFLAALRERLGPVKSTERTGWHVNYGTGGSTVTLVYQTTFANGAGTETFVYQTGDPPRLAAYNLNSPALLMPPPAPVLEVRAKEPVDE